MNIALLAHDGKKERWSSSVSVLRHSGNHSVCAPRHHGIWSARHGSACGPVFRGDQGCISRSAPGSLYEIDPSSISATPAGGGTPRRQRVARLCDVYNIPFASNVATPEVLSRAVGGDWLAEIVRARNKKRSTEGAGVPDWLAAREKRRGLRAFAAAFPGEDSSDRRIRVAESAVAPLLGAPRAPWTARIWVAPRMLLQSSHSRDD
jgi:methylglyoxal synthase